MPLPIPNVTRLVLNLLTAHISNQFILLMVMFIQSDVRAPDSERHFSAQFIINRYDHFVHNANRKTITTISYYQCPIFLDHGT